MLTSGSDAGRQAETAGSARGNGGALLVTQTANWVVVQFEIFAP